MQAMEVYVLSITICISFILDTSLSMKCSESMPTISIVSRCPSNATEWDSAAKRKGCNALARIQNCTNAANFVYHCVLNEEATMLVEVCAPIYYLAGYCSRYSEVDGKFINKPDLDCTVFDPPCPKRFTSNKSYKYQKCYEKVIKQQQEKNHVIQYVPLVIVLVITLTLLIILAVGCKLKWIKCRCGKKHGQTEGQTKVKEPVTCCLYQTGRQIERSSVYEASTILDLRNTLSDKLDLPKTLILVADKETGTILEDDTEIKVLKESPIEIRIDNGNRIIHNDEEMVKECKNLTGNIKVTCSLQASSAILDLRNALAKELDIPQTLILVVDKENGIIFQDDIEIETLKQSTMDIMLGNQDRIGIIDADGSVENNVISNKYITYGKCTMSCGHFTDPDTLFDWTKEKLPGGLDYGLPCPRCPSMIWGIEELVEKCNMSADEIIFFKYVADLNKSTAEKVNS